MQATIAFVDDDARCLNSIRIIMSHRDECSGWELIFTTEPAEALSAAQEGRLTALVTDEHMPSMSGHELINRAKSVSPELIAILLSGSPEANAVEARVVEKPCDTTDLIKILKTELGKLPEGKCNE